MAKFARSKVSSNPIHDQSKKAKSARRKIDIARQDTSAGRENLELHATAAKTCHVVRQLSQTDAQILGLFAYEGVSRAVIDPESLRTGCGLNPGQFSEALSGVLPEFVQKMKPRDALEKLALEQLMVQHARALSLSRQASLSRDLSITKVLNEACDGASSSFRRLMTAFRDHRRPKDSGPNISIGQANLAQEQIVQNLHAQEIRHVKNSGEQTEIRGHLEAAVSVKPERLEIAAGFDPATAALDEVHRTKNSPGESPCKSQRPKARRAVGRKRRAPKAGAGDE